MRRYLAYHFSVSDTANLSLNLKKLSQLKSGKVTLDPSFMELETEPHLNLIREKYLKNFYPHILNTMVPL